jgi:hypothetical protein
MYKIKKELPKQFKIKVNPKQSEALQKHLLNLGVATPSFNDEISYLDFTYLYKYDHKNYLCADYSKSEFTKDPLPQIKFKDYFEAQFPEKWCIDVTEDNYQELRTWIHANNQNYKAYAHTWFNNKDISVGRTLFSHSEYAWDQGLKDTFYEHITTEQFREQFGMLTETKAQGTDTRTKELEGYTTVSDKTILEEFQERKELRKENEQLKKYNQELQTQVNSYYHKLTMLNEKLEMIKKLTNQ